MSFKLGKLAPRFPAQLPKLRDRLTSPLPKPVLPYGYGLSDTFPMALNATYGDCAIAGKVHADECAAAALGQPYSYPGDPAMLAGYAELLGRTVADLENDPQQYDTGLELATVIEAWSSSEGFLGTKIIGAASIDIEDYELIETAAYNFGCLYVGVQLPVTAQTQFPGIWHTVSNGQPIEGGHCIVLNGAQKELDLGSEKRPGMNLITWGEEIAATEGWLRDFLDEAWVVVPEAFVTAGHDAVQSLDLQQMKADIAELQAAR